MKNILKSTLILGLAFVLTSFVTPGKGYKYESKDGKMSIVFPMEFTETVTESEDYTTTKVMYADEETVYMVSYTEHKIEITEKSDFAEVSLKSFVESLEGKIIEKSEWKVKGNQGLSARIEFNEESGISNYYVIMVENVQIQIVVASNKDVWGQKSADRFAKSFKLSK